MRAILTKLRLMPPCRAVLCTAAAMLVQVSLAQDHKPASNSLPPASAAFVRPADASFQPNLRSVPNGRIDTDSGVLRSAYRIQAAMAVHATPELTARAWMTQQGDRFGWDSTDDLVVADEVRTAYSTHLTFQQLFRGIPVHKRIVKVNLGPDGLPTMVMSGYAPHLNDIGAFSTAPTIAAEQARRTAEQMVSSDASSTEPALVVFPLNAPLLAWHVIVWPVGAPGEWEVLLDARSGAVIHLLDLALRHRDDDRKQKPRRVDGTGMVWTPDPLTSAGVDYGWQYQDFNDADAAALNDERSQVSLLGLELGTDNKVRLKGPFVSIDGTIGVPYTPPAEDNATDFHYLRANQHFEAVMVYYHVDASQRYVQSLNIGRDIQKTSIRANPHGHGSADNSTYHSNGNYMLFGDGGIDDGEDAEIILHEYAHALLEGSSPGLGLTGEANALHEGWADYWAVSYTRGLIDAGTVPAQDWKQVFDWDANLTWSGRTLGSTGTYPDDYDCAGGKIDCDIYADGTIWATAMMELYDLLGKRVTDRLNLLSHGYLARPVTFVDAAEALIQADEDHYQKANYSTIASVLVARGFLSVLALPHVSDQQYFVDSTMNDLALPAAVGGTSPYSYTLTPALPSGLSYDGSTRTVSGTPSAAKDSAEYTYTATDAAQATVSQKFYIEVAVLPLTLPDIADQEFVQGKQITAQVLPEATGGTGTKTYALTPALPEGLTFDGTSRTLSGTPSALMSAATYTYTATDAAQLTTSKTFSIEVVAALLVLTDIPDQEFTQWQQITAQVLPEATGGTGAKSYALTPALPAGLTFDGTSRTLSGTPTVLMSAATYTYTATDAAQVTTSKTFSIEVVAAPLVLTDIPDQEFTHRQQITAQVLPEATGGTGAKSYSIAPALPAGLTFDAQTRTLSGAPVGASAATPYAYTATDEVGLQVSTSFAITVHLALPTIQDQVYVVGLEIPAWALPAAEGGAEPYQYTIAPALPGGVTFSEDTRTLSGTPSSSFGQGVFTYQALDAGGATGAQTFTMEVLGIDLPQVADQHYVADSEIAALTLPAAIGGISPFSYALTPELPPGLAFDQQTHTLSGTPAIPMEGVLYEYAVTDSAGHARAQPFWMIVHDSLLLSPVADQAYKVGEEIAALVLPAASGGLGAHTYSLGPALPAGLFFDAAARLLTGTPTTAMGPEVYTYAATDTAGYSVQQAFEITVFGELVVPAIADQSFMYGQPVQPLILPAAAGGVAPYQYTLDPALPDGLTFDPDPQVRTIGGTPSAVAAPVTYRYTATDGAGDSDSQQFQIEVTLALVPIADQKYETGQSVQALLLPAASGGTPPYAYSLTPSLPSGLLFDSATRSVSGTPSEAIAPVAFTYVATDAAGLSGSRTFLLEVQMALPPILDQVYTVGTVQPDLVLPEAGGGSAPVTYAVSPTLPAGLQFDAATRVVSGVPTAATGPVPYAYEAMDAAGLVRSRTFLLEVRLALVHIADQAFAAGEPIAGFALPAAEGGTVPYTYVLSPALPAGLHFDSVTRVVSGAPTTVAAPVNYTYTATDAAGLAASQPFSIEIYSAVTLPPVPDVVFVSDQEITPLVLPTASGGRGMLRYRLDPDLPAGLVFDSLARTLSGTPTEVMSADYTYVVEDSEGSSATQVFNIEVLGALLLPSVADQRYTVQEEIVPLVLPAATGGRSPYSYALSPDVPAGLAYDDLARTISGSPSAVMKPLDYTYSVTDALGTTTAESFEITVGAAEALIRDRAALIALYDSAGGAAWTDRAGWLDPPGDQVAFTPEELDAWYGVTVDDGRVVALALPQSNLRGTLPAALGDLSALEQLLLSENSLEEGIPQALGQLDSLRGLLLNDNTLTGTIPPMLGRLAALEQLHLHNNELTGTITDSLGELSSLQQLLLSGNQLEGTMPSRLGRLSNLERLQLENNRLTGTLPDSLGQLGALAYLHVHDNALSGALPASFVNLAALQALTFGGDDQRVCAPVDAAFQAWLASVQVVSGPGCNEISLPFAGMVADQLYTVDKAIAPLVLPEAEGGAPPYHYSIDPALPPGLAFDAEFRAVAGTPTEATARTLYTYAATDMAGRQGALAFAVAVAPVTADGLVLHGNYPNPFNELTYLEVSLDSDALLSITVFDLLGRRVLHPPSLNVAAGVRRRIAVHMPASAPGIYLYQVRVEMGQQTRVRTGRMAILR